MAEKLSAYRKGTILNQPQAWAVVLAGGDGTRLRSLTQLISGEDRPKQFCQVYGGKTLLAQTRARLARVIHPERTAFAVVRTHERFYRNELADVEPQRVVVQPGNKGTTAAVIFSLLRIRSLVIRWSLSFPPIITTPMRRGLTLPFIEQSGWRNIIRIRW